jgi:hypothetical protein
MRKFIFVPIFFIICLLIFNCSAIGLIDCEGSFTYAPNDFTLEEQAWIEESASRWNVWVGYTLVKVIPGEQEACSIVNGFTVNPDAVAEEHEPTYVITIDKDHLQRLNQLNQKRFEAVVMHELGHALGYDHILNGKALMAPSANDDFTDLDRAECIRHNMCKP